MQTTLLGVAIAIILALVSALVAPLVIDWNQYRTALEEEATRLTGLAVRVDGSIDVRILPTPRIELHDVEVGAPGHDPLARADTIELEVGLGPLLRGEVRATELRLVAPQINLGLDRSGAIAWPAPWPSFPGTFSVSRLNIEDGRVILSDLRSGSRLVLHNLWLNGDARSLGGPFKGEGAFVFGDELYGYRLSGNRADADAGLKLRLVLDASNYPLTADLDGVLGFASGVPQFDGTMGLAVGSARPAAAAKASRPAVDPWRLSSKLRATPEAASLKDLILQYGPSERALDVKGQAKLTFGEHPHLDGTVSARHVNLDRGGLALDAARVPPFAAVKSFVEAFVGTVKPPIPAAVGISVDGVTFGGTAIQSLHGDVRFDDKGWSLSDFAFRMPGATEVKLTGRLDKTQQGLAFNGAADLESSDLRTLMAWVEGRGDAPSGPARSLAAHGDVAISSDRFALDRLTAQFDQENMTGRLAYTWASNDRPAALDAELHAAELDVDPLLLFARAAIADGTFEVPRDVAFAVDIGKATFAGVDARMVNARVKFDAGALQIGRLSVGDLGGAALDISGRIDELSSKPRGRLTLDLDAKALAGLAGAIGKFAPQEAADWLRRSADRLAPAKVHGVLAVDRAANAGAVAKLDLDGKVGALRVGLSGEARGEPDHLGDAVVRIDGRLNSDDGGTVTWLLGLDRFVAVDQRPGQVMLAAVGPLNGDIRVNGAAAAGGFSMAVEGTVRVGAGQVPTGNVQLKASADLRPLYRAMTGQAGAAATVSAASSVAFSGMDVSLSNLAFTAGRASLNGHLALGLASPLRVNGEIEADNVDGASVAATFLGAPTAAAGGGGSWSAEPFAAGAFGAINGEVKFKVRHATIFPAWVARDLAGVARFARSEVAVDAIDGGLAGGHLTGELAFRHDDERGFAAHGHLELAGADAATFLASSAKPVDGLLTLAFQGDAIGLSPEGLFGSLHGSGSIVLADAHFAGIDTAAFDAAIRAADRAAGGAVEASAIRAAVSAAMANGHLAVPEGVGDLTITGGQIRLANSTLQAQGGAELALGGVLDLNNATLDARLSLSRPGSVNALISGRPELAITFKGSLPAPKRTLDVSALVSWLTLRAAEMDIRRLQSMEANRREEVVGAIPHLPPPAERSVPPGKPSEATMPANAASAAALGVRGLDRLRPETPSVPSVPDDLRANPAGGEHAAGQPSSSSPSAAVKPPGDATAARRASPLPPPHSVAPAPGTQPPAPAADPTERSFLDYLFGSQN